MEPPAFILGIVTAMIGEDPAENGLFDGFDKEEIDLDEKTAVSEKISQPFDPELIRVLTKGYNVQLLVERIARGEIELSPDFQRSFIWDNVRQSRLIESILLRIPIPVFYVSSDAKENWAVVDGLQRLTTIYNFYDNSLQLVGLEYLTQFEGVSFDDLPRYMQRRILETELLVHAIQPGTPEEAMFNIFKRINTGGLYLNGQEIRHALHKGPARDYLKLLAKKEAFLKATDNSLDDRRMGARECVLRFLAFWTIPYSSYTSNDLDSFLNERMSFLNGLPSHALQLLSDEFTQAMERCHTLFGRRAFRKIDIERNYRPPVSKALLESWAVTIGKLSSDRFQILEDKGEVLLAQLSDRLKSDQAYSNSISFATGVPQRVHYRFQVASDLIAKVLNNA